MLSGSIDGQTLYAAMVPLRGSLLLLPNVALVEVVGRERLHGAGAGAPEWLLGDVALSERRLPAIDFEVLCGATLETPRRRGRLAVINALSSRLSSAGYAIACSGHPQLLSLTRGALTTRALRDDDRREFLLARVAVGVQEMLVPDLERIEAEIAATLAAVVS